MNLEKHPETQRREVWLSVFLSVQPLDCNDAIFVADSALKAYEYRFLNEYMQRRMDNKGSPNFYE